MIPIPAKTEITTSLTCWRCARAAAVAAAVVESDVGGGGCGVHDDERGGRS